MLEVTMSGALALMFAVGWVLQLANHAVTIAGALLQPRLARRTATNDELPLVTIIMPMDGLEPELAENLDRLFGQDYPHFDVMLSFARADAPAIALAREAMRRWPAVKATLPIGEATQFIDLKVRNEFKCLEAAATEFIYIVDSNVSLPPDALRLSMRQMRPDVAIVTAAAIAARPGNFVGQLEMAFINGFGTRYLLAGSAVGFDITFGKSMLVRWSAPIRRAVTPEFAEIVPEDTAFLSGVRKFRMRARFSSGSVIHPVGARPWRAFWGRHTRWIIYRRLYHAPTFYLEIISSFWPTILCGALGAQAFGISAPAAIAATAAFWFGGEWLLHRCKRWPMDWQSPIAWLAREVLLPVLWARAFVRRDVTWNNVRAVLPRR